MSSMLDTIGPITKTVKDSQVLLQAIAGYDPHDAQTVQRDEDMLTWASACDRQDLHGIKLAIPQEFMSE